MRNKKAANRAEKTSFSQFRAIRGLSQQSVIRRCGSFSCVSTQETVPPANCSQNPIIQKKIVKNLVDMAEKAVIVPFAWTGFSEKLTPFPLRVFLPVQATCKIASGSGCASSRKCRAENGGVKRNIAVREWPSEAWLCIARLG